MKYDLPVKYDELNSRTKREVRNQYREEQGDKCYYCGEPLTALPSKAVQDLDLNMDLFPRGFLDHPIHLHHDHFTGYTLGAVHAKCNGVLWQYLGE